jgi:hypothetical protein
MNLSSRSRVRKFSISGVRWRRRAASKSSATRMSSASTVQARIRARRLENSPGNRPFVNQVPTRSEADARTHWGDIRLSDGFRGHHSTAPELGASFAGRASTCIRQVTRQLPRRGRARWLTFARRGLLLARRQGGLRGASRVHDVVPFENQIDPLRDALAADRASHNSSFLRLASHPPDPLV